MPRRACLIINADDLGYSDERDDGIVRKTYVCKTFGVGYSLLGALQIEGHTNGLITSASGMANGCSLPRALAKAHKAGLPVGLHLNFTEGCPVAPPDSVPSLLNDGFLRGKFSFRQALAQGLVRPGEMEVEARAQVLAFIAAHPSGAPPTHWDGHQHIQVLPDVLHAVLPVMASFGVWRTRIPRCVEDLSTVPKARKEFYEQVAAAAEEAVRILASYKPATSAVQPAPSFCAPAVFIGYSTMGCDMAIPGRVRAALQSAQEALERQAQGPGDSGNALVRGVMDCSTVEWMVHPGHPTLPRTVHVSDARAAEAGEHDGVRERGESGEVALQPAGCGDGPDKFSMSDERELELQCLLDKSGELRLWLTQQGFSLADYRQVQQHTIAPA